MEPAADDCITPSSGPKAAPGFLAVLGLGNEGNIKKRKLEMVF